MTSKPFYYEHIELEKKAAKRTYENSLADITSTREDFYNVVRDVAEELELVDYKSTIMIGSWPKRAYVSVKLKKHDTITNGVNEVIDTVEEILTPLDFKMDLDCSKQQEGYYELYYNKGVFVINISVFIASSDKCKARQVEVTKTNTETIYTCEEVE
jgi:hypothetical protein